jgi:hypothetical protein
MLPAEVYGKALYKYGIDQYLPKTTPDEHGLHRQKSHLREDADVKPQRIASTGHFV